MKKIDPEFVQNKSKKKRSEAMKAMWAKKIADGTSKRGPYKKKEKREEILERLPKKIVTINKMSISERLDVIEHNAQAIRQQLGV